jgi:DNA-binding transcriptional regulator YiaG
MMTRDDPTIVKEARKKLGLTQKQFAALFPVSTRTVGRWESGEGKLGPGIELLIERLTRKKKQARK